MIDDGDCGAIGGMKIGRGNRSTRSKRAPVPLCPSHDLTRARTQVAAVGSRGLAASVMARSFIDFNHSHYEGPLCRLTLRNFNTQEDSL
jgi:hypothetical protein